MGIKAYAQLDNEMSSHAYAHGSILASFVSVVLLAQGSAGSSPNISPLAASIIAPASLPTSYPLSLTLQNAAIENQIRNTLAHYPLAIDGKNFDALDLVFTDDAVANYSAPLNVLTGLDQIKSVLQKSLAPVISQHSYGTQVIEIEAGHKTAKCVSYYTASQFGQGEKAGKVRKLGYVHPGSAKKRFRKFKKA